MPVHASDVYARNLLHVMQNVSKDGELNIDLEDEINDGSIVVHAGEVRKTELAEATKTGGRS